MKKTKYITFQTQKGGSGKTTLCVILAGIMAAKRSKVLVVDTDEQESIFDLIAKDDSKKPLFNIMKLPAIDSRNLHENLKEQDGIYDYILIDTPGKIGGVERGYLIEISDLIIIPLVAAWLDTKSTMKYLDSIELVMVLNNVPMIGIINKFSVKKENKEILELDGYNGLSILKSTLSHWVYYDRELSVSKAMINKETMQLYKEIKKLLK